MKGTNVYNLDEIQAFLDNLQCSTPAIKRWTQTTLRRWMINSLDISFLTSVPDDAPTWAKDSLKNGDLMVLELNGPFFSRFQTNLEHAIGYLKTVRDPRRVGFEQAVKEGEKLIEKQNKQADDDEGEIKVLHEFKDGWAFVSCLDAQALKREGKLMQHCVGTEQMGYLEQIKEETLEIWSLRDPNNGPHCTIEYDAEEKIVDQIQGKQNKEVIRKYRPYVVEFLKLLKEEKKIEDFNNEDLASIGMLNNRGTWLDIYNLPKGLILEGDLYLSDTDITSLPEGLTVGKSLYAIGTPIKELPEGLAVGENLALTDTKITSLPEGLITVGGYLDLCRTPIKELPEGLAVKLHLNLRGTKITSLPEGLTVGGNLDIRDTKITSLPEGLTVGKSLYVSGTLITSLPEGLKVGGVIFKDL